MLPRGSRLAIIGTGISGLAAAHRLHREFDLRVFEASDYVGGHTNTLDVAWRDRHYAIDTGFIVFNDRTYPGFCDLMDELGVTSKASEMSFSVRCAGQDLEYSGASLGHFFAQRRNLLRPSFWWLLREIPRFHKSARRFLEVETEEVSLVGWLRRERFSKRFREQFLLPMGAAIWSASLAHIASYPARNFLRFFANHGMLQIKNRPQWRVVAGGSRRYVETLTRPFRDRIHRNHRIQGLERRPDGVSLRHADGRWEVFDGVILAVHSDQALRLLDDPSIAEVEVLASIPYQTNEAVLHIDAGLLPQRRRLWSAWNYHLSPDPKAPVGVTYNMNILQGIEAPVPFCVTLNQTAEIDPGKILRRIQYRHPIFNRAGIRAQQRCGEICGQRRTWYCGAWLGSGFHEDGLQSGYRVADALLRGARAVAPLSERDRA